ncbi:MAG: amidohydrolase [Gemmatimonadota bacterium]|nr:amidohydrolase [Gemmatimonadota bacterium]
MSTSIQSDWPLQLDRTVDAYQDRMVETRRHLHTHPEVSGEETETTRYLEEQLASDGFNVRTGPTGRGVIAESAGNGSGPGIAMRADLDALPIQDAKSVAYRSSVRGVMHACGHDAHAAAVLGAALALDAAGKSGILPWPVSWRVIFQPAEETNQGALEMIDAGALEGVCAMLALHVDPSRPAGTIGHRSGVLTAHCDEMRVLIRGSGGHAARPYESRDPIAAAAQLINALYVAVPRSLDPGHTVVLTVGSITAGKRYNAIPDRAVLKGTVRSLDEGARRRAVERVREVSAGVARVSGTEIEITFRSGPPSVMNDPGLTDLVRQCAVDLLGADRVQYIGEPSMGGDDFAHYLKRVPGSLFRLGCSVPEATSTGLHTPDFDVDERALGIGAKILARAVVRWSEPKTHGKEGSR